MLTIGIRREDKNQWERRVPLSPKQVAELIEKHNFAFKVQPSPIRAYGDEEYLEIGAQISEDLSDCDFNIGVKEMPKSIFVEGGKYLFFSHTIKAQPYNMAMLQDLIDKKCTLVDYERIVDDNNRRLIFFGQYAGLAGMIDSLWALGQRLEAEGTKTQFLDIKQANGYKTLAAAKDAISAAGEKIKSEGLPSEICPVVFGFAGYGNVSQGAQDILSRLPVTEITPDELLRLTADNNKSVYKVVFKEKDMVAPKDEDAEFELQDYYQHPEKYKPSFEKFLPELTVLMNCIYWEERYPRMASKESFKKLYAENTAKLKVIGDISCDVEGSLQCTLRCTDSGKPVYIFDTETGAEKDAWTGKGPLVLAVDNLPAELAFDSSRVFGAILVDMLPELAAADYSQSFENLSLAAHLKRAIIVYRGELTEEYRYLEKHLHHP